MKQFVAILLTVVALGSLSGCGGGPAEPVSPEEFSPPPVSGGDAGNTKAVREQAKDKAAAVESMD